MHVATLYDLHGNLNALESVLHEIPDEATIVVGGDVCAGGTHPSETLERLRALGERVHWLRGNADRELTPGEQGLAPAEVIEATRAALTAAQIAFLHALPRTVQIDNMLFCHATPRNDLDIFTARTPEEQIVDLFADVEADIVVCGHTHTQFERTIAGKRVINSGSVGMPYEDAPGAYWTLDLTHRRTEYDGAESPKIGREEAISHFESLAAGARTRSLPRLTSLLRQPGVERL
jgi:putative phosphoesterase